MCVFHNNNVYVQCHNCFLYLSFYSDARPPPMDPSDSAVEFSQTHFSRDDDLISLQIEPHRYEASPDC